MQTSQHVVKRHRRLVWGGASAAAALLAVALIGPTTRFGQGGQAEAITGSCGPNNKFGRLIPSNPAAAFGEADLTRLGSAVTETSHIEPRDESDIDAGYTYVGQFIDHDITLDPRPDNLTGDIDPATLVNNRTPQLDLDSVYGNGPTGSPQLYESDGIRLKLGAKQTGSQSDSDPHDVLRDGNGQGVLGDGRNDENRIVGSLHSIVTRFHNLIASDIKLSHGDWSSSQIFTEARKQVRWHYQWAILKDFLPQMSSQSAVQSVANYDGSRWNVNLRYYDACRGSIPTEFAVAAYRWHTMVRNDYIVNDQVHDLPVFNGTTNPRENLAGFQPAPSDFGFDWDYFFSGGNESTQKAYKLDDSLVPALGQLPGGAAGNGPVNLSVRNLLRGSQLRLPSGQSMAQSMGVTPLRDDQIIIGPALGVGAPTKAITEYSPAFAGKSPLWTYLFAESVNQSYQVANGKIISGDTTSLRLGPVGRTIVNETLVGLMANDPDSVINHPEFRPNDLYLGTSGDFKFRDLINAATSNHNLALRHGVSASSSLEAWGWSKAAAVDGGLTSAGGSQGWGSNANLWRNHAESITLDLGAPTSVGKVSLWPRTDGLNAGYGFPVNFNVDTSLDGSTWTRAATVTGVAKPAAAQQDYAFPVQPGRYVRITGTSLRSNPWDFGTYRMQFAEVGVATGLGENPAVATPNAASFCFLILCFPKL